MTAVITTNTTTASALSLAAGDGVYILDGVHYIYTGADGFAFTGASTNYLDNAGFLIGGASLNLGRNRLMNRASGTIYGAVSLDGGDNSAVNYGVISSNAITSAAVSVSATTAASSIVNYAGGVIDSSAVAVARNWGASTLTIRNYGHISGNTLAYAGGIFLNAGTVIGDIDLGAGADRYDGSRGTIDGTVFGGDGRDVFLPGAGSEIFDGGTGFDQVNFSRSANAVQVFLDGSAVNNGLAAGDTYIGVETFVATARDDTLVGDASANIFFGGGGADTLDGRGGADVLVGGMGSDTLFGGEGNDSFVYNSPLEGSVTELISGFANRTGDNDTIRVSAAGFGGGLTAGTPLTAAQLIVFSGTFADTADARFYLDTSQNILSYDADGSGSAFGRVPLCKFVTRSGAFSQADFFVVA